MKELGVDAPNAMLLLRRKVVNAAGRYVFKFWRFDLMICLIRCLKNDGARLRDDAATAPWGPRYHASTTRSVFF